MVETLPWREFPHERPELYYGPRCPCGMYEIGPDCPYCMAQYVSLSRAVSDADKTVAEMNAEAAKKLAALRDQTIREVAATLPKPKRKRRTKAEMAAHRAAREERKQELIPDWLAENEEYERELIARLNDE